jgi:hypothetical protein
MLTRLIGPPTHCYSANLVAPGIEPGTLVSAERNPDYMTTEAIQKTATISQNERFEVFHGGDYEEWCLLGCYAMWLL